VKSAFLALLLFAGRSHAQTDSLNDVFPLAVGNQWTYDSRISNQDYLLDLFVSSVGTSNYEVLSREVFPDSTIWRIRETVDDTVCYHYYFGGNDTCVPQHYTMVFPLVEMLQGRHRLIIDRDWSILVASPFPFERELTDTTSIYRYPQIDSIGPWHFHTSSLEMTYDFVFAGQCGEISVFGKSHLAGLQIITEHRLTGLHIVSVSDPVPELPNRISLSQNYPNPFNPTTTIEYSLPGDVGTLHATSLQVFDLLGRCVATLVDGRESPGTKSVRFDAGSFPGGVYFYRLRVGDVAQTRKMVVLK
jgi:hypothetical protein